METLAGETHLDTHVVMWMFEKDERRLAPALPHVVGQRLVVSPMVLLELQYLHEIGRTCVPADLVYAQLAATIGLGVATVSFAAAVRHAFALDWTRDPFDRLIAATALAASAPLVTRDETIRTNLPCAVWA